MCTLVAVWMWVPWQQDLTMMGTNGCHFYSAVVFPDCLIRSDQSQEPPQIRGRSHCHRLTKLPSDEYRRSVFFLLFLFFFLLLSGRIRRIVRLHKHVHISVFVLCICFTIQNRLFLSSITCSFEKSRMMRHV